jgi:hypothetical protein
MSDEHADVTERARVVRGRHYSVLADSFNTLRGSRDAFATTFGSLAWSVSDIRRRRRLRALIDRVGPSVGIDAASEGDVRIEGKVELIDPVSGTDQLVALHRQSRREAECRCNQGCNAVKVVVRSERRLARFVLRDESGGAVIEPSPFELLDSRGDVLDPFEAGERVIEHGSRIVVIGEARREPSEVPGLQRASGYRATTQPLVIRGREGWPVRLFVP